MEAKPLEILLVEDNEDDAVLIQEGFHNIRLMNVVQVVKDGIEAMDYLQRRPPYENVARPGIVLLDINMPRMNGFEVLQEMKGDKELKHIPVVMLTTSSREEDVVKAFSDGAASYISKPAGLEALNDVVAQFGLYWTITSKTPRTG